MIHLYSWPTPNGQKIQILLEELGVEYVPQAVNILRGDQFKPEFLGISPNNKIPAIVDADAAGGEATSVFETGAIMLFLAQKYGRFLPQDRLGYKETLEWLFFQNSSLGPMLGQATHFRRYAAEAVTYAVDRYTTEAVRLYGVLERRLEDTDWLAANQYTIADMAAFPWICRNRRQGVDIESFPRVKAWRDRISSRPAVGRGMDVLKEAAADTPLDGDARANLFKA